MLASLTTPSRGFSPLQLGQQGFLVLTCLIYNWEREGEEEKGWEVII